MNYLLLKLARWWQHRMAVRVLTNAKRHLMRNKETRNREFFTNDGALYKLTVCHWQVDDDYFGGRNSNGVGRGY